MNAQASQHRLLGFPLWLAVPWCIAAPGSAYLVTRFLYEETFLTWREGPQMVGFSFFHTAPVLAIFCVLSVAAMHLWIVSAIGWICFAKKRGQAIQRRVYWLLAGTAMAIVLVNIPYSWFHGY